MKVGTLVRAATLVLASGMVLSPAHALTGHEDALTFHDGFEGIDAGPFNDADASRFLAQATFGPTDAEIARLRTLGYNAWLTDQFDPTAAHAPPSSEQAYADWVENVLHEQVGQDTRREAWMLHALGGQDPYASGAGVTNWVGNHKDQLRQRMAFALSEILVVSDQNANLNSAPRALTYYYDILVNNAFGNYRTLLELVTLSPAMGEYLNMRGNQKADSSRNIHPDENYAREINQLFSIGLVMLDANGVASTTPTYTQDDVATFAHVFTGWNFSTCTTFDNCGASSADNTDWTTPMKAFPAFHDNGVGVDNTPNKQLLHYTITYLTPNVVVDGLMPNNQTPQQDLTFALNNIYNHPNVAPFVCKQLIQRLVTSNPTPAYVGRVAKVFNDNRAAGNQLQLVAKAILLDPEARYGHLTLPDSFGKLREPLLMITHHYRAMDARHTCGSGNYANQYRYAGYTAWGTDDIQYGNGVGQAALSAASVFNFFKPGYIPPTSGGLLAPEFQLETDSIIANSVNARRLLSFGYDLVHGACDPNDEEIGNVGSNFRKDFALAANANGGPGDPSDRLVDAYNKRFMSGEMSAYMRQNLITYLNQFSSADAASEDDWRLLRIKAALYLILTSPEYMIQK